MRPKNKNNQLFKLIPLFILLLLLIGMGTFGFNKKASADSCVDGQDGCLFGWNMQGASGRNWPGWTWKDDAAYGHPGWWKNDGKFFGGNWNPRSMAVDGYGTKESGLIDTTDRAPSTNSGACLKVYDTGEVEHYQATWWVLLGDGPLYLRNITNANTDRMSFYLKTKGTTPIPESASRFPNYNFHIGTYLCWGDYIPLVKEGPGNQHYYHHLVIDPGTWLHVLMDQHPMHRRSVHGSATPHNDPRWEDSGKHYFEHLLSFYMEITHSQPNPTSYKVDEMKFYSTKDTYEPAQNDISISTPWVGYWQNGDYWEMGWQDGSWYDGTGELAGSTFDVRWSTSPITNKNFDSANKINPELFAVSGTNLVRRPNAWSKTAWTRFKLPDDIEQNYNHIYFAIKDVSINGGHIGPWPYNHGDGHDAPSSLIHTIDYYLRPDTPGSDITPPILSNPSPSGTLLANTTSTTLSVATNENATCRYSTTAGTNYTSMANTFAITGGTSYSATIDGLTNGSSYTYYIRCQDTAGNANTTDYPISFSITNPTPPTPTYTITNFISLITHWLDIGDQDSDVNNDGIVNARDLGIIMSNWHE